MGIVDMLNAYNAVLRTAAFALTKLAPQWAQAQTPQTCADLQWSDGMAQAGQIQKYFSASVVFFVIFLIVGACFPAHTFAQKLQPSSSCGRVSDNAQYYVTSGLTKLVNCWDSWSSGPEYQVVVSQYGGLRVYSITEYANSQTGSSSDLFWYGGSTTNKFRQKVSSVGLVEISSEQLPKWAINVIADNRDIFEYLIQKTNLVLPSLQDDPKTVGRGVRGG